QNLMEAVMAPKDENKKNENSDKIIDQAMEAYGIEKKYVHLSRVDKETGEAVIVTVGGKKVRYAAGQAVARLKEIDITGINFDAGKRKVIAGAKK
ncbi:MAG: hypothetical protein U1D99_03400, partial [Candidatus Omnitrophota bacterium]|nr:hypothetical protein [Candidatus Omnitrophota bacterium]